MENEMLNELKEIKKLLICHLLATGVTPGGVAKLVGLSEKSIRNQFPLKELKR